jgi:hypothetical protein
MHLKNQGITKGIEFLLLLCVVAVDFVLPFSVQAQIPDPTATPNAEGIMYAEVREGDSLWAIASRSGLRLEELLALNGMTESSIIRVGDLLIIGYVTPPATATSEPTITPTLSPPTVTYTPLPLPETAVCLLAYVDANQNGIHDAGEKLRPSVAFTIFNENAVAANYVTTGVSEPHCVPLQPGTYQITRSSGRDEFLTTDGDVAVVLRQGDVLDLAFGGYIGATATPSQTPEPVTPTVSPEATLSETTPTGMSVDAQLVTETAVSASDNRREENGRGPSWLIIGLVFLSVLMIIGVIFFVVRMRQA